MRLYCAPSRTRTNTARILRTAVWLAETSGNGQLAVIISPARERNCRCRYGRGTAPIQPQNAPGRRGGAGHRAVGLDEWLARFEQLGIRHSPIAEREYGAVLTFKDPDGIQFAMFLNADDP